MTWWHYLLLVNFYLVLFFGFYALLLRRETFFQLNRIYLVAASLLSFTIPLIQSNWVKNLFITQQVQNTIYNSVVIKHPVIIYNFIPVQSSLTIGEVLNAIYISVTLFLVLRLIYQLVILKRAIEKPSPSAAYSFFKKISLGDKLENHDVIEAHERVHAGQWHSVDVMIIETVMIINWFNPVVYLYRFAIKYIHEFIADRQVVQAGTDKVDYALLLLSQTFNVPTHALVNPFYNHTLLKQRIKMLQKNKSHRIALAKYGLSAPLFMLMLVFSSATINNSSAINSINQNAGKIFSQSAQDVVNGITNHAQIPTLSTAEEVDQYVENYNKSRSQLKIDTSGFTGDEPFTSVENAPKFPGSLGDFLRQNIRYPAAMRDANVQGSVRVEFIVETDGSISHIKAISSPGYGAGEEAERVMALSPKWTPAHQNGKSIRLMYTVPINFSLGNNLANTTAAEPDANKIFAAVEKQPDFPGGSEKFNAFLTENIQYPAAMRQAGVTGRVIIQFVVEPNGTLSNIQVISEPGFGAGQEAVRVLTSSPKWIPGYQNGRAVRVSYTVPVNFTLGSSDESIYIELAGNTAVKDLSVVKDAIKRQGLDGPIYILDGVIKDKAALDNLDIKTIEGISISKKGAFAGLGVDASKGVVNVRTLKHTVTPDIKK